MMGRLLGKLKLLELIFRLLLYIYLLYGQEINVLLHLYIPGIVRF